MFRVLERNATIDTGPADGDLTPAGHTPTGDRLPRRMADFATLGEALDYAARGQRGMNFHDARGTLTETYSYARLRDDALGHASRFVAMGLEPGDRLALVAETGCEFAACFFGAIYAAVAVPLGVAFIVLSVRLQRIAERRAALRTYLFSLAYLAALFVAMVIDARL